MTSINEIKVEPVQINLDKPRTLLYDLNAFAELESSSGKNFQQVADEMSAGSMKCLRSLVWAGLLHEDKTLDEHAVGKMIGLTNLESVIEAVMKALVAATSTGETASKPGEY